MKTRHSLNVEAVKPPRKTRNHAEQTFHIHAYRFLRTILPQTAVVFHVPNGGKRSKIEAAILKQMGVTAGIPDFILFWDRRGYALELKTAEGELDIEQRGMHAALQIAGIPVEVVRTFEEIIKRLNEFGIPLRRTVRFGDDYRVAA